MLNLRKGKAIGFVSRLSEYVLYRALVYNAMYSTRSVEVGQNSDVLSCDLDSQLT